MRYTKKILKKCRTVFLLLMILSVFCTSCASQGQGTGSPSLNSTQYELLDGLQWKADCRLGGDHVLWMSFENPNEETFSFYVFNAWQMTAVDWYAVQKKAADDWITVPVNYAIVYDRMADSMHAAPGEKMEVPLNLDHWNNNLKEGDTVRVLLGLQRGELSPQDIYGKKPAAWLSFTCVYRNNQV